MWLIELQEGLKLWWTGIPSPNDQYASSHHADIFSCIFFISVFNNKLPPGNYQESGELSNFHANSVL